MKIIADLGIFHFSSLFLIADFWNYLDGFFIYSLQIHSIDHFPLQMRLVASSLFFKNHQVTFKHERVLEMSFHIEHLLTSFLMGKP